MLMQIQSATNSLKATLTTKWATCVEVSVTVLGRLYPRGIRHSEFKTNKNSIPPQVCKVQLTATLSKLRFIPSWAKKNDEIKDRWHLPQEETEECCHERHAKLGRLEIHNCYRLKCVLNKKYAEVPTPTTSKCYLIWKQGLYSRIRLKRGLERRP